MAVNAITSAAALATSNVDRLPAIVQTLLTTSGVVTPDSVFNLLSLDDSGLSGLAAAPYINSLTNLSVSWAVPPPLLLSALTGLNLKLHASVLLVTHLLFVVTYLLQTC